MIQFVNAKINLGLKVVRKRPDGYHDLETIFYPIGLYNGTPENPEPFCDVLEITENEDGETHFDFSGRVIDCPLEKNLVYKAWSLFRGEAARKGAAIKDYDIKLEKHIPDGAGLGGGSADASFVLKMLNELEGGVFSIEELARMALQLGADCPFFIYNRPMVGRGVGDMLTPANVSLAGMWLLLIKPDIYISTKDAFSGITPREASGADKNGESIENLISNGGLKTLENDFEKSVMSLYPEMSVLKNRLYEAGAEFALMSGSGSSLYGIFPSQEAAREGAKCFSTPVVTVIRL